MTTFRWLLPLAVTIITAFWPCGFRCAVGQDYSPTRTRPAQGQQVQQSLQPPAIVERIFRNWVRPKDERAEKDTRVEFTLLKDGSISEVSLVESSGNKLVDSAVVRALEDSAPFHALAAGSANSVRACLIVRKNSSMECQRVNGQASKPLSTALMDSGYYDQKIKELAKLKFHEYDSVIRQAGERSGMVAVRVTIARDGRVNDITIYHSSQSFVIDKAAEVVLRETSFPVLPGNVESPHTVTIDFSIDFTLGYSNTSTPGAGDAIAQAKKLFDGDVSKIQDVRYIDGEARCVKGFADEKSGNADGAQEEFSKAAETFKQLYAEATNENERGKCLTWRHLAMEQALRLRRSK
jgi:TonB family protein